MGGSSHPRWGEIHTLGGGKSTLSVGGNPRPRWGKIHTLGGGKSTPSVGGNPHPRGGKSTPSWGEIHALGEGKSTPSVGGNPHPWWGEIHALGGGKSTPSVGGNPHPRWGAIQTQLQKKNLLTCSRHAWQLKTSLPSAVESYFFRDREWERERERLLMSDGKESHSVYSSAPLSPMRSEEFDYQQSNITLLKVFATVGSRTEMCEGLHCG